MLARTSTAENWKKTKVGMNKVIRVGVILCMIFFSGRGFTEEKATEPNKKQKVFRVEGSIIENPLELRDPFKKKRLRGKKKKSTYKTILVDNSYSNLPDIGTTPLSSIRVVGILLGKKRVAMAQVNNSREVYLLREGMKIGQNKSEIRAILPGGIVVVEKIRNIYEQDEYIETAIPFSGGL